MKIRVASLLRILVAAPVLFACSGDSSGPDLNAVASVSVTVASSSIYVGETAQCTATARNASGQTVSATLTWSSSNASVATVDPNGLVTGVSEGSATIRASAGGVSGTGQITVLRVPVASVSVTPDSASVVEHETVQLTAAVLDDGGATLSGRTVTWSTSDSSVAAVDSTGLVTGVAPGAATVTAASEGKTGTAAITVEAAPVASVSVTPDSATVILGHTQAFAAQALDGQGRTLAGRSFAWTTADSAVATVDGQGLVTGVALGVTTVTATVEGKSGSAVVTVVPVPVASVTVEPDSAEVPEGRSVQLTATPRDEDGNVLDGRSVAWSSSDEGVATVDGNGLLSGVSLGSATITATSEGKSGTAAITVVRLPVDSVSVAPANPAVVVGDTLRLSATTYDDAGEVLEGRVVTWSSGDEAVATVDAGGLVTGVAIGQTTITATSEGVSGSVTVNVVGSLAIDWITPSGGLGGWSYLYSGGAPAFASTVVYFQVDAGAGDVAISASLGADTITTTAPVQQGRRYAIVLTVGISGQTYLVSGLSECATFTFSSPQASDTTTSTFPLLYEPSLDPRVPGQDYCPTTYKLLSLTVENVVETVTVSPATATVQVGQTTQLTATTLDADGVDMGAHVFWNSSNSSVATVDTTGLVTGVAPGTATITATRLERSGTAQVTVVPAATDAYEPDDVSGQATSIVSGERQVHDINPASDEDWVTFTLAAAGAVRLETIGPAGGMYMTLYDSQLNALESADDYGVGSFVIYRDCGTDELAPGTYFVKVTGADLIDDYELNFLSMTCDAGFDIELKFVGVEPTASQRQAVENAAARWEELIVGDVDDGWVDWPDPGTCGGASQPALFQMIDDFLMLVEIRSVDGAGGSLGTAGACGYVPDLDHPGVGGIVLDQADLDQLEADGTLETVALHYMGHALGFGNSWNRAGLLQSPSDTSAGGTAGADTHFSGSNAITAFDAVGGSGYAGAKVPVENDQSRYGTGQLDQHWRESVFGSELMSTELDPANAPASIVTVRSLEDLGYEVDAAAADAFALPSSLLRQAGGKAHRIRFQNCLREGPPGLLKRVGRRD